MLWLKISPWLDYTIYLLIKSILEHTKAVFILFLPIFQSQTCPKYGWKCRKWISQWGFFLYIANFRKSHQTVWILTNLFILGIFWLFFRPTNDKKMSKSKIRLVNFHLLESITCWISKNFTEWFQRKSVTNESVKPVSQEPNHTGN